VSLLSGAGGLVSATLLVCVRSPHSSPIPGLGKKGQDPGRKAQRSVVQHARHTLPGSNAGAHAGSLAST
jgi:hypothetical protein